MQHTAMQHTAMQHLGAIKHGHASRKHRSRTYNIWLGMIQRSRNPKSYHAKDYVLRGVTVCLEWYRFEAFLKDMGECPEKLTIGRIDNNKGYCPENCKWETRKQQSQNTRRSKRYTILGINSCLKELAERFGISYNAVRKRISRGWSIERALEINPRE